MKTTIKAFAKGMKIETAEATAIMNVLVERGIAQKVGTVLIDNGLRGKRPYVYEIPDTITLNVAPECEFKKDVKPVGEKPAKKAGKGKAKNAKAGKKNGKKAGKAKGAKKQTPSTTVAPVASDGQPAVGPANIPVNENGEKLAVVYKG